MNIVPQMNKNTNDQKNLLGVTHLEDLFRTEEVDQNPSHKSKRCLPTTIITLLAMNFVFSNIFNFWELFSQLFKYEYQLNSWGLIDLPG